MISVHHFILFTVFFSMAASAVLCQVRDDVFITDLFEILVGTPSPIQDPFGKVLIHMSNQMQANLVILAYFMKNNLKLVMEWAKHNPMYAMLMVAGIVRMYTDYIAQEKADEGQQ